MIHRLEADSVQLAFNQKIILSDIYLKCETGKITGLLGRNGQGKTCLMNIIFGSLSASGKSIRFDNVSIGDAYKRADLVLFLPQFNFIPKSLSLKRIFSDFNLSYPEFEKSFPEFQSQYTSPIKNLSGGQRRLTEVYIIIKSKTQFALLDEPFSHLMPLHIEKIRQILLEEKHNKGLLITDHMYQQIIEVSDNLYILKEGKTHLSKNLNDIETLGYASV